MSGVKEPLRVLFLWTNISGYMSASWKALSRKSNICVKVIAVEMSPASRSTFFSHQVCDGIDVEFISKEECIHGMVVSEAIREFQPNVIVTAGWIYHSYRKACIQASREGTGIVMAMDTPWKGRFKQHLTWLRYFRFLSSVDHLLVASDHSEEYGQKLGFPKQRISRKLYAWDESLQDQTLKCPHPSHRKGLLFIGRYEKEKGIDELVKAYASYREKVEDPWPLHCCGAGTMETLLNSQPGIVNHGFTQPNDLPDIYAQCGVFLFPSTFEPWGVALVEAMGCGLTAIASKEVGAARELIQHDENGLLINAGSSDELCAAILQMHHANGDRLMKMSELAKKATIPFQASNWANRVEKLVCEIMMDRSRS